MLLDPDVERPRAIIELFLRVAPADLAAIESAPDAASLQQAAHKLKGTSSMLGLRTLGASCRALDEIARQGDYAGGRALIAGLIADFEATCAALRAEL